MKTAPKRNKNFIVESEVKTMTNLTREQKNVLIDVIEIAIYLGLFIYQGVCLVMLLRRIRARRKN